MKQHKIFTMQDVIDVITPENKEAFLADLSNYLDTAILIKEEHPSIQTEGFIWVDDGKNDCDVVVETKAKANKYGEIDSVGDSPTCACCRCKYYRLPNSEACQTCAMVLGGREYYK